MPNVFITGGDGFIGRYVYRLFPDAVIWDKKQGKSISDAGYLQKIMSNGKIDVVIHLAAAVSVPESEEIPQYYLKNNVIGTMNVIDAAIKAGVKKIVYASSSSCQEPTSSIYALTKYVPELLLEHYKDKINVVSLRFFNVYGKGSNPAYGRVIDAFITGLRTKGEVTVYGDGYQTRDFIHVSDVARGIQLAVKQNMPSGEVIDLGTGESISVLTLINKIADLLGLTGFGIKHDNERKEVRHSIADTTKAREVLGFLPIMSLEEGIKTLI